MLLFATSAREAKCDVNARRHGTYRETREDKQCRRGEKELDCEEEESSVWAAVRTWQIEMV